MHMCVCVLTQSVASPDSGKICKDLKDVGEMGGEVRGGEREDGRQNQNTAGEHQHIVTYLIEGREGGREGGRGCQRELRAHLEVVKDGREESVLHYLVHPTGLYCKQMHTHIYNNSASIM